MSTGSDNYYAVLGIPRSASPSDVQAAFEARRARFAVEGRDPATDPGFQVIQYAFDVLSDAQRRELYDSLLAETAAPSIQLIAQSSARKIGIMDTAQVVYVLVEARPLDMGTQAPLPLNLALVIDRSTSMRGKRLEQVKTAVQMVLDKLAPSDVISVVSFSDRAEIVLPARHIRDQQGVRDQVLQMEASGGTEIFQGLAAGMQQLHQVDTAVHTNHLILLTDGHTYGDAEQCFALARRAAEEGISMTAFGIGEEWNDAFLDALVAPTNGRSDYIHEPVDIISHLENRIQDLGAIFARRVRLHVKWPTRVWLKSGFKLSPFAQPLTSAGDEIALGEIEGRAPLVFLLELVIAAQPIATRIKIPLTLSAILPADNREYSVQEVVELAVVAEPPPAAPDTTMLNAARLVNLHRMNEKALQEADAGRLEQAATRMRHLSTRYLETGEVELAQQASLESQRLARMGTLSPEGRKQLKYGTRTLLGQTVPLEWHD